MRWEGSRRDGAFVARVVDWYTWEETGDYVYLTGGKLELSYFSSLKASGSVSYEGEVPDALNLLRLYYRFTDDDGETGEFPVATMLVETDADEQTMLSDGGYLHSGSAKLQSVLKVLRSRQNGAPFTIPANTDAVNLAVVMCESLGLRTNRPRSSYVTSETKTFKAEDADYLSIVNWLMSAAGFESVTPDAYGVVQMREATDPTERAVEHVFAPGADSVMRPKTKRRTDWVSTPNAVRLWFANEVVSLEAYALNVDPDSRSSLPSRGWREVTLSEEVSELPNGTPEQMAESLRKIAVSKLADNSADIDYVDLTVPFLPIQMGQAVAVRTTDDWRGIAVSYGVNLGNDAECSLSARRFVRFDFKVESGSKVVWSA